MFGSVDADGAIGLFRTPEASKRLLRLRRPFRHGPTPFGRLYAVYQTSRLARTWRYLRLGKAPRKSISVELRFRLLRFSIFSRLFIFYSYVHKECVHKSGWLAGTFVLQTGWRRRGEWISRSSTPALRNRSEPEIRASAGKTWPESLVEMTLIFSLWRLRRCQVSAPLP
jgi:hypothetical protein